MKTKNNVQYAILRFAKYKGPAIGNIEAHNERTKETYISNPDINTNRSTLNFHLLAPQEKYRTEAERQISASGCRTRKDSVRMVETLLTASPTFFKGKKLSEIKAYFAEAVRFMQTHQPKETIISAHAPHVCASDGRQSIVSQRDYRQSKKANLVARRVLETHGD